MAKRQKYSRAEAFSLGEYEIDFDSLPNGFESWSERQWHDYIDKHGKWTVPVNTITSPKVARIYGKGSR